MPGAGNAGAVTELVRIIRERIIRGDYGAAGRMPSESDLTAEHGVPRSVVRKALADLMRAGLVVSLPARGYRALNLPPVRLPAGSAGSPESLAAGWAAAAAAAGLEPGRAAGPGQAAVPGDIAARLGLGDSPAAVTERLFTAGGVPCLLASWWYPAGAVLAAGGPWADEFTARLPDAAESGVLTASRVTPCIQWTRSWDSGTAVLRCLLPASRVVLTVAGSREP